MVDVTHRPLLYSRHPLWRLTAEQKADLTARYIAGGNIRSLAQEFGVGTSVICKIARRRGAERRNPVVKNHLPMNHAAFAEITPESAYWVGFLMADGSIFKNRVGLFLGERDRNHLEAFRAFLQAHYKICTTTRNGVTCCAFAATSTQIVADLSQYGVVPRKTLSARCQDLEMDRDFWRGVVDGDGWLGYKVTRGRWSYPGLSLCGSIPLMTQFACFIGVNCGGKTPRIRGNGSTFAVQTNSALAVQVARLLYQGSGTALERKRALAIGMYSS